MLNYFTYVQWDFSLFATCDRRFIVHLEEESSYVSSLIPLCLSHTIDTRPCKRRNKGDKQWQKRKKQGWPAVLQVSWICKYSSAWQPCCLAVEKKAYIIERSLFFPVFCLFSQHRHIFHDEWSCKESSLDAKTHDVLLHLNSSRRPSSPQILKRGFI